VGLGARAGGSVASGAAGVSRNGSVVVGWGIAGLGTEAFRWTSGGGMVGLGFLPSGVSFRASEARDVSADGSVVVGETGPGGVALIWDEVHGMRSLADVLVTDYGLDLTGWSVSAAMAISSDGSTIVGNGGHDGVSEAWIAVIPEPSTGLLFGFGLVVLAAARGRAH